MRRRVTQTIIEIDEAIRCKKRQSLELWVANLESLNEELKSLQHHIEEYISEEGLQHRFNAIYGVSKKHNRHAREMYGVL